MNMYTHIRIMCGTVLYCTCRYVDPHIFVRSLAGVMHWRNLIGQMFKSFVVLESGSPKTFSG